MKRLAPLLILVLAGCSAGNGDASPAASTAAPTSAAPTTAAPATSVPTTPAATTPAPTATTPPIVDAVYFKTPSGNIGCAFEATAAACDIFEKSWTPPSKPSTCEWDWGHGLHVSSNPPAKGRMTCGSDTVHNAQAPALTYGQKMSRYGFTCESRRDGVRCTHDASRHGFFLSRDRYELF